MTKRGSSPSASSSSSRGSDLASLFDLSTVDMADRLSVMLEAERTPHYRCRDYLHQRRNRSSSRRRRDAPSCDASSTAPSTISGSSTRASSRHSSRASSRHSSRRAARDLSRTSSRHSSLSRDARGESVAPASRAKIVRWLYDIVDYLELDRENVAVAVGYVDRFMSKGASTSNKSSKEAAKTRERALRDVTHYQLLAVAALLLAAKQSDKATPVDAPALVRVSHGSYSAREIVHMETVLLDALEWRLCGPTSLGVAHHLIGMAGKVLPKDDRDERRQRLDSVVDFARLQLELATGDYASSVLRTPSTAAAAAVVNAMDLLDFSSRETRAFAQLLHKSTGFDLHSQEVDDARSELHEVFEARTSEVMGRAPPPSTAATEGAKAKGRASFHTASSSRSPVGVDGAKSTPRRSRRSGRREASRTPSRASARNGRRRPLEP